MQQKRRSSVIWAVVAAAALAAPACDEESGAAVEDTFDASDSSETDAGAEVQEDVATLPDVDWETLPRLPEGKTFTTRYAAGAAERDITPEYDMFLGGFGFCGGAETNCRKSQGVHDRLHVAVVAIADTETGEVVMFAGVDSSGMLHFDHNLIHGMVQRRLYDDYGVYFQGERIVLTASHSHSAPDMAGLWGPMFGWGRDDEYAAFVRQQATDAAAEAFGNLGDIQMVWARGSSPNSTDGVEGHPTDDELIIVRGTRPDDTPVFTLSRWNAHPTAYGSSNNGISADWWGPLRKMLADEYGGIAVHLTGAVGGTYPERPNECGLDEEAFPDGWRDPDLDDAAFMKVTCTGKLVFDNAVAAMASAQPVDESGVSFRFHIFGFHPDNELLMLAAKTAPVPFEWVDIDDPSSEMITETGLYKVGNLTFIATPGESFPSVGNEAKRIVLEAGYTDPVVLGLANDWLGYILMEDQWKNAVLSYNQGLSCGRLIAPALLEALQESLDSL